MKTYELVCVIESTLSADDSKALVARIEGILTSQSCEIKETDNMGLMPLAYPLNGQSQATIISYYLTGNPDNLTEIKSQLRLEKGLAKYFFYGMHDNTPFMMFSDLKKTYEDMTAVDEEIEEEVEQEAQQEEAQSEE